MNPSALRPTGRDDRRRVLSQDQRPGAAETSAAEADLQPDFVAELSHELRTTLLNVTGYAEMLLRPAPHSVSQREVAEAIQSNSRYLTELLDSLLDLARRKSKPPRGAGNVGPRQIAADLLQSFRVQAEAKGLALKFSCAQDLPDRVLVDATSLRRILVNLVSNAIKYSQTGTVTVRAAVEPGPGKNATSKRRLVWTVQDQGPGFSSKEISRLGRAFSAGTPPGPAVAGGIGLGLFITSRLVESLGGELSVVSRIGHGSTFFVSLPLATADEIPAPRLDPPAAVVGSHAGRILLVENDLHLQSLMRTFLASHGLDAQKAGDGEQALSLAAEAETAAEPFDAVLLDFQMPRRGGESTARALRARGYCGAIIAFSAADRPSDEALAAAGFTGFVNKSAGLERLLTTCLGLLPSRLETSIPSPRQLQPVTPHFMKLQSDYVVQLANISKELRSARAVDDRRAMQNVSHRIMGTSGLYGLDEVAYAACRLNAALLAGQLNQTVDGLLEQLDRQVALAGQRFRRPALGK
jgi:CheY-like chemotaxis protein/nitrogen-specific signal transduction histidine kinase